MITICWLRRTGATTWRSFPPLQMIIAIIIIVMFYSIFFCCSIWTLIRVCVGHTPRHSTSIIPLPHTVKRFNLTPISAHSRPANIHRHPLLCGRHNIKILGNGTGKEGNSLYQLDLSVHSSALLLPLIVLSVLAWYLRFFFAVESWPRPFLTQPSPWFLNIVGLCCCPFPSCGHAPLSLYGKN